LGVTVPTAAAGTAVVAAGNGGQLTYSKLTTAQIRPIRGSSDILTGGGGSINATSGGGTGGGHTSGTAGSRGAGGGGGGGATNVASGAGGRGRDGCVYITIF
jgi:hypothetical protein